MRWASCHAPRPCVSSGSEGIATLSIVAVLFVFLACTGGSDDADPGFPRPRLRH